MTDETRNTIDLLAELRKLRDRIGTRHRHEMRRAELNAENGTVRASALGSAKAFAEVLSLLPAEE